MTNDQYAVFRGTNCPALLTPAAPGLDYHPPLVTVFAAVGRFLSEKGSNLSGKAAVA
jgi:hypothetical protein